MNKNLPLMGGFYLMSLMGLISSFNWFMFWIFLELNTLCFIPLILMKKTKKSGEAALLYFVVQAVSSMYLLLAVLSEENFMTNPTEPNASLMFMAFLKMSAGVFFNWLYLLSFTLTLSILLTTLTVQKLGAFFILLMSQPSISLPMLAFVLISSVMAISINMKQNLFKSMLSVSSLSNTSWLVMATFISWPMWLFYFTIYSTTLLFSPLSNNKQLIQNYRSNNMMENPLLFLSLGGLPPLPGFFPKLLILSEMNYNKMTMMGFMLVILACVDIFIYLRFSYSSAFNSNNNYVFYNKMNLNMMKILPLMMLFMMMNTLMLW